MDHLPFALISALSNQSFLGSLYVITGLIAYRTSFPRFSLSAKRLAAALFAAQVLIVAISIVVRQTDSSDYVRWLWHLSREWNIPAYLASTQISLVGILALVTAAFTKGRDVLTRIYLLAVGIVFLFLALDEFFIIHETLAERIGEWKHIYAALSLALALSTLAAASRSRPRAWIWHAYFIIGLAVAASGGLVLGHYNPLDPAFEPCGDSWLFQLSSCLRPYELEESLELLGIWLTLLAMLGLFCRAAPRPSKWIRRALFAWSPIWLLFLFLNAPYHYVKTPAWAAPTSIEFENGERLYGYAVEDKGRRVDIVLYLPNDAQASQLGYSIHLVDQISGESVASANEYLDRDDKVSQGLYDYKPLYRQRAELDITPQAPRNRAMWITLSLWREHDGEFDRQKVLSSDLQLLDQWQIVLSEAVLPRASSSVAGAALAAFDNGFLLTSADLSRHAQAGDTLSITFDWRAGGASGSVDYNQFVHLVHSESGEWRAFDQPPLGARLPTRLWYSGLADTETWRVPLPADLRPGNYTVFTGLYRAGDGERVPVSNAGGVAWRDQRVSLGAIRIE